MTIIKRAIWILFRIVLFICDLNHHLRYFRFLELQNNFYICTAFN
ncbi:hypothetical protein PRABACTJOHN_00067 [Parabacteroides johnsonii DSM 18315]|uniref:Uncharacterized protein n=1 Tax=Parabacteroides johnsonii DSM 18315 TaxID=537006 RepID=B7B4X6_9BACT|nr:hypothetical protein PRABACTJOHN_00067 [Parabacteroides johnsonii DSM 18315]